VLKKLSCQRCGEEYIKEFGHICLHYRAAFDHSAGYIETITRAQSALAETSGAVLRVQDSANIGAGLVIKAALAQSMQASDAMRRLQEVIVAATKQRQAATAGIVGAVVASAAVARSTGLAEILAAQASARSTYATLVADLVNTIGSSATTDATLQRLGTIGATAALSSLQSLPLAASDLRELSGFVPKTGRKERSPSGKPTRARKAVPQEFVAQAIGPVAAVVAGEADGRATGVELREWTELRLASLPVDDRRQEMQAVHYFWLSVLLTAMMHFLNQCESADMARRSQAAMEANSRALLQEFRTALDKRATQQSSEQLHSFELHKSRVLWSKPGRQGRRLGSLRAGQSVKLLETRDEWMLVEAVDFKSATLVTGWLCDPEARCDASGSKE
jgi:hypothetical protein